MKRVMTTCLSLAAALGTAFAETPDELLDYVESDGSAYIDTGIVGKSGTKVNIIIEPTSTSESYFLASRSGNERFLFFYLYNNKINVGFRNKYAANNFGTCSTGKRYNLMADIVQDGSAINATCTADGTALTATTNQWTTGSVNTGLNMYLFGINWDGAAKDLFMGKCYGTKIWQTDSNGDYQLVRDFVPCKKGTQIGLWDRVSGEIFYPATGTLTGGDTVAVHAEPDEALEYVESDGRQYIDTGVIGRDGTKAEIDFKFNELGSSSIIFLGADDSDPWGNDNKFYMLAYRSSTKNLTDGYAARFNGISRATTDRCMVTSEVVTGGVFKTTLNGTTVTHDYSTNPGPYNSGRSLYLFTNNRNGVAGALSAKARCYGVKIWQTDENGDYQPACNYTPCKKDGKAALYDSVSGMVFFGRGADLIAPPDTESAPDAFVDYVESDGTQYIDTGINAQSGTKATAKLVYTESDAAAANASYGGYVVLGAKGSTDTSYLYMIRRQWNGGYWSWMTCYGGRFQWLFTDIAQDAVYDVMSEITTNGVCKATLNGGDEVVKDYSGQTSNGTVVGPLDTGVNFYAFAANLNGSVGYHAKVRLYSMTISQMSNGVYQVVRDFKPCIKDGVAALYDEVSKTIFYPATGRLRAADETAPAKFVEYVESDGTQYVDTGITGKAGVKAAMTFNANASNGNPAYLLSSYGNSVNMNFCYFGQKINVGFGGSTWNTAWSYSKGTQYALTSEYTLAQKVNASLDGEEADEKTASGGTDSGVDLYAFARNNGGTADGKCSVKLYSMKIWQADDVGIYSLARDFRPCVATNGIAALYDKVSGTIFYPQGGLLATGGVERAAAVTARWKGGAVMSEADLAVAGNWECFDADGNVVEGATPTAATTVLVGQGSALLSLPAGVAVQDWAGVTLTNSVTLAAAGDWSPLGLMTLASGVTVDLNGKDLVSGGFALADGASATVANSGATATLTFAVADGSTASMDSITFASNIMFAKTGAGTLANSGFSVGYQTTGSFSLAEGTCKANGTVVIGDGSGGVGTFEQTGGTFDISGYLTMGYLNGAYGTYTMTGGHLFVRNLPLNLGQTATASQPSTLDVSGTAVATFMHGIAMSVYKNGGTSALNVHDGGRIRTSSITKGASENANPTVTFDGGILEPLGNVKGLLDGMPLTVGSKGFIVDTAGYDATFGSITLASGAGPLVKTGAGTLTLAGSPAWSAVVVSNGTLSVAAAITLPSVHLAEGTVLDLGGNTVRCGALTGAGTVTNGTLVVTGTLTVTLGAPVTFTDATLDVSGARVELTNPEDITDRDPITVATSNQSISGHARTGVRDRRVQITQSGTGYVLEFVWNSGLHLFIR